MLWLEGFRLVRIDESQQKIRPSYIDWPLDESNPLKLDILRKCSFHIFRNGVEMGSSCPKCDSNKIEILKRATKVGTATGAAAGGVGGYAGGAAGVAAGAKAGAVAGFVGGPAGAALGSAIGAVAGGVLGALGGASLGAIVGSKAGATLDEHVFDNRKCNACGHTFSAS